MIVALATSLCASCATTSLWESTNPRERVLIPESQITQAELDRRGVAYESYNGLFGSGYLVEKGRLRKFADYTLLTLGTPIAVAVDAVTTVSVGGALILVESMKQDPDSWNRMLNK